LQRRTRDGKTIRKQWEAAWPAATKSLIRAFLGCSTAPRRSKKLFTGCRWAEGPAYFAAGRYLVWSDIPNDRMMRYDETDGSVSVFRQPAGNTNGNTVDRRGAWSPASTEAGGSRTEHDGAVTTVASHWRGKRLNSPNDVVVKSDGSIWFTDRPTASTATMKAIEPRAKSGLAMSIASIHRPARWRRSSPIWCDRTAAFSPDESLLYVADTGRTHGPENPAHIRVFEVDGQNRLSGGNVFADCTVGFFDGFRLDTDGRIWTSAGDGIHCYHRDGTLIGKVLVPEIVANCVFGGPKRNILYICGTTSLYAVRLMVNGVKIY
jgi:gluconolactonase